MSSRPDVNRIRERAAQAYGDVPKYQQFSSALADVKTLLAEVERLETWTEGLQATTLRWAQEFVDLRSEVARLSTDTSHNEATEAKQ